MDGRENLRGPFLSLKWKALILTTLLLGSLTLWVSIRSYCDQVEQLENARRAIHREYEAKVSGSVAQSRQRLFQAGAMIPALAGIGPALRSGDAASARTSFDGHWPHLQVNMGVEVARLYDTAAQLLGAWGPTGLHDSFPTPTPSWVLDASSREQPRSGLTCRESCMQYAAVPLLDEGRNCGVAVLGASLADVVLGLRQDSGVEVGVLVTGKPAPPGAGEKRHVPAWGAWVTTLTGPSEVLDILREAARVYPTLGVQGEGMRVEFQQQTYEVLLLPLEGLPSDDQISFVAVSNISRPLAEIRATAKNHLYVGVLSLLVGEGLLLALLGPPVARLRRTAEYLPLLAEGEFPRVRGALQESQPATRVWDETDILDETTRALADRLESLEEDVRTHGAALRNQMAALSAERDFVTSLLETAQVLVLTQTREGRVTMLNQFGRALLGSPDLGETGSLFTELVTSGDDAGALTDRIRAVADGRPPQYQHEAELPCRDGSRRYVTWIHSRLLRSGGETAEVLSVGMDVTARKSAESRLAWLAEHDPLTGLYNRKRFAEEVEKAQGLARRHKRSGAVLLVDLDQFKYFNDTTGHQAGDLLLNVVAHGISRVVRSVDTLARLSSDEFGILVPETDERGAVELAKKVSAEIESLEFPVEGTRHHICASVGIALFTQEDAGAEDLLTAADLAMNQAKEEGRGRWHLYSPDTQARRLMHEHVRWKNQVEQALVQDRFVMHYQPILHVQTRQVTHYEALLRMLGDAGELISPAAFIPACERTGLIHAIDKMVLEKVIAQLAQLTPSLPGTLIHINVSAFAFENPDFVQNLRQTLDRHDVAPSRVVLELTETATVADFSAARALMGEIRRIGCSLALDDFGVGFSSLGYLKELPVDFLKIDGSFIRRLHESRDDQILVRAMGEVAKGFGKKLVAEYVENDAILEILADYGIDYAQGYAIGRPCPPEEVFPPLPGTSGATAPQ
ncbi:MAG: EAL domain-containing protein [Proteobacteria bacterium]|nr:EAL domain-containing protein [Pseudomonadota bacterium]